MSLRRRNFLQTGIGTAAGALAGLWTPQALAQNVHGATQDAGSRASADAPRPGGACAPVTVTVLDVPKLPWDLDNRVKVFRLIAEPIKTEVVPARVVDVLAYNRLLAVHTIVDTHG